MPAPKELRTLIRKELESLQQDIIALSNRLQSLELLLTEIKWVQGEYNEPND